MTVAEALAAGAAALRVAGVPSPEADAERLLRHVLGADRARLLAESRAPLGNEARRAFDALLSERARRRPLQHLVGTQAFWKHDFLVTPDVLIPRPETELIVEEALRLLEGRERPVVADVGTGSGCLALSLAFERPDAEVHAVDLSPAALEVARRNAERLDLGGRVRFHQGDLLAPLRPAGGPVPEGRLDLVVSNPPYVDPADREGLAPEVRDHEPALALFPPGPDPTVIYARLAVEAREALVPGGALVVEIGQGMEDAVSRHLRAAHLREASRLKDLQGIVRTLVARRD